MTPDFDDDDDEGPFEEIVPGVEVRSVSDEYAADVMGITVDELHTTLADIESGKAKTITLDELIEKWKRDDPEFEAKLEAARAEHKERHRRRYS